jgi:hypothetical protein
MNDEDLEDFCGVEYDRGLGRKWVCSLPFSDNHSVHKAYAWHNISDSGMKLAEWNEGGLLGYLTAMDEWIGVTDEV